MVNTHHCNCEHSVFKDPHHKHIIIGDLRIVKDRKFCTLLTKVPNYGENKRINWNKAMELTMIRLKEWMREQIDNYIIKKIYIY